MKTSEVIIKGLTFIQANSLAILCENGEIGELINTYLERVDILDEKLKSVEAEVDYSDKLVHVTHDVNFNII